MCPSPIERIVLLPGLDGTGALFSDFVAALPPTIAVTVVGYPKRKFLGYDELRAFVREIVANFGPFVLLGESFSSPLSVQIAASRPSNLAGLIICAGFVSNPFPYTKAPMQLLARPFLFRLRPSDLVHRHYVAGWSASPAFLGRIRENLRSVAPEVLAGRVQEILKCDARQDLVRTSVPVLYLQAAYDRLIRSKCYEEVKKLKPEARLASIPAPHLVLQTKPQEAAAAVMKFIRDIETAQAAGEA